MHYLIRQINTGYLVEAGYDDTFAFKTWDELTAYLVANPLVETPE